MLRPRSSDVTREGGLKKGVNFLPFFSALFLSSLPPSTPLSNYTLPSAFFSFKSSNIPSLKQHQDARKGFSRMQGAIPKVCLRFFPTFLPTLLPTLLFFVLICRFSHSSLLSLSFIATGLPRLPKSLTIHGIAACRTT